MNDQAKQNAELLEEISVLKKKIKKLEKTKTSYKQAEKALRESEEKYRLVVENTREAIIITQDAKVVFVNHAAVDMVKYSGILTPKPFKDFIHPDDLNMVTKHHIRRIKGEEVPPVYSFRVLSQDGTVKWVELSAVVIQWQGRPATLNLLNDITDRKQAEEALRASEIRYQSIFETTGTTMLIIEEDMTISLANHGFESLTGYTQKEVEGKRKWTEFIEKGDLEKMITRHQLRRVDPGLATKSYEFRLVHRDGYLKNIILTVDIIPGTKKSVASLMDITDRKRAEEELWESEEKYRNILENIEEGYYEVDLAGNFTFVNDSMCRTYGYLKEELLGLNYKRYLDKDNAEKMFHTFNEIYKTGKSGTEYSYEVIRKDGVKRYIEASASLIKDSLGEPAGFKGIVRDVTEHREMEEVIRQSEERYRTIIEQMEDGYFETDLAGNYTFANDSECRNMGYSREEIIGMNNRQYVDKEQAKDLYQAFKKMYETGIPIKAYDLEVIKKDGTKSYNGISAALIRDVQGKPIGFRGVSRDVTERKLAEETLTKSEEKFRKVFNTSPDAMHINRLEDYVFISINPGFTRITGYTEEDIIGKTSIEYNIWANIEDRQRLLAGLKKDGEVINLEATFRMKNGDIRYGLMSASVIDLDGVPHILNINRDITEQKRAEEAQRQSEERYRSLVENANEAILVIQDGMIKFVNSRSVASFGYSEKEYLSTPIIELVHPEDRDVVMERYLQKIKGDITPTRHTYRTIHKSGQIKWIEISSVLIDWEGRPATLNLITDITESRNAEEERRRLERRLQRAEKMEALGQLAGGVAHDLNNVLGALTSYSELLLMEIPEGQRARSHVEKILQSTEKGAAIIHDLLTLARRGVTVSDVINLNNVVSGFLKTPVFEKMKDFHPRVTFQTECQDALLNIKGSPVHLEKALMNLVSNAAESISGKGEVTIRTENRYLDKASRGYDEIKEGDYAILTVSDTGMGIPAENKEKIFEPFYTKKTMGRSGTGLGLSIVWGTVKDHNGYIDVQTKVGEGTTFTLYFPVTREEMIAPQQKEPIERYMGRGESVLVVDDIAEQRDAASGLLKKLGYDVHAVSSGEEAVEYLKRNKADILVLDMIMVPGIDGLETYQRVLHVNPKQKAILVSGFSETNRVREAQKLGAGAYLRKPYVMEKIGVAIRDELNR